MASKIDFGSLTLNSEEARSTSECVFEKAYARPELAQVHGVQTGVEQDKYIPIFGQFGLVGKADPGSCGVNTETGTIPTSQKQWTPKLISGRLVHCQANIPDLIKFWKKSRIAANTWEEVDNEMMAFITDTVLEAVTQSILRHADFGDTAADVVANGGQLTAGTNKAYFNVFNGLWKQIFADQAGSAVSHRYSITENAAATKAEQLALASNRALLVFRDLYNNIDARAFQGQNLKFQVTRSLLTNWQDFMEDKSMIFTLDKTEKGSTKFTYRGIPIEVRHDWERIIRTYHDVGDTYYLPHRAILTDINNIPIGTSDNESLASLDSFYDKVTKSWYVDFAYKLDQKNLLEYNLGVAY